MITITILTDFLPFFIKKRQTAEAQAQAQAQAQNNSLVSPRMIEMARSTEEGFEQVLRELKASLRRPTCSSNDSTKK